MKIAQTLSARVLGLPVLVLLFSCSGTSTTGESDTGGAGETPGVVEPTPTLQDAQDVSQQRRDFLIREGLGRARRAMQSRLYADAMRESAQVLELDPTNEEARNILLGAQEILGEDAATVTRQFQDRVLAARISLERDRSRARSEMQQGDALVELGKFGDAIESYERSILILELNPLSEPGSTLQREAERKRDLAMQMQAQAMQDARRAAQARSQADLAQAERLAAVQRGERVNRLLVQANRDFQLGNFDNAVQMLDQALHLEPNNTHALGLRDLAGRARHDNRVEVLRQRWKEQWVETFDDLRMSNVPQTEAIKFDLARWAVVRDREPLRLTPPEDLDSPEERAIRQKLQNTKLEHRFSSATLNDWSSFYARMTDVNFVVAPSARELDEEATTLTDFNLPNMSVEQALNVIESQTGVKWTVDDGVVKLVSTETPTGRTYLVPYGVRDLVLGVRNQAGPELKLRVPGEEELDFADEDEPSPTVVDDGKLQDLIRNNIAPETWDETNTLSYQSGVLLIRATRDVHTQVENLLADLRRAVGIQVDVEARFLRVEDNFLEDIGVDFRGLGNQSSEGIAGRGLEQNNRSNLRFDDFGRPEEINSASPGEIGTGTEPGIFFDDGADGDLLGRTENLYDRTLGGGEDGLDNSGGLSLQYAYLDDVELEIVLRAVAKQERSEQIVAPRLLIYNNTRAHMQALRHTSYIRDFDVEIAQAAAVANPIVDVVRDGVVLDVRPVVSADRRFITMELRPTVMNLQLPIPTFTTTLGAGQPVSIQLPNVTLQRVRTTVTMPDGGTIMLGGMKMAERQDLVSGIPILQDLPGLSFLFSRKGTFVLNRKIIILIRASIVMTEEHEPQLLPDEYSHLLEGR